MLFLSVVPGLATATTLVLAMKLWPMHLSITYYPFVIISLYEFIIN